MEAIPFLTFDVAGQRYGIDVAQVEALLATGPDLSARSPTDPRCKLICDYEGEPIEACSPETWLGLPAGRAGGTQADSSRVLVVREPHGQGAGPRLRGLLVNVLDIVTLPLDAIHPLPPLVQCVLGPSPVWAVGRVAGQGDLILLVDASAGAGAPGEEDLEGREG